MIKLLAMVLISTSLYIADTSAGTELVDGNYRWNVSPDNEPLLIGEIDPKTGKDIYSYQYDRYRKLRKIIPSNGTAACHFDYAENETKVIVLNKKDEAHCLKTRKALIDKNLIRVDYACQGMKMLIDGKLIECEDGTRYRLSEGENAGFFAQIIKSLSDERSDETCPDSDLSIDGRKIICSNGNVYSIDDSTKSKLFRSAKRNIFPLNEERRSNSARSTTRE